jgi:diadenosine tetraphosphatase ApaH/serine/threonine PP2A family protein phosphatase
VVPFVRIALLADVHANLEALTACLGHAEAQGAEAYAFLGDLVGYGPDPVAVLDVVADHAGRGAVVVRGNHDAAALADDETLTPSAARAASWTRQQLGPGHRAFLSALPLTAERDGVLYVHASAADPAAWTYVSDPARASQSLRAAAGATWVFSGHVHEQALYFTRGQERPVPFRPVPGTEIPVEQRRRWLAIVGSAGQPRDGNTAACYALFDRNRATLTFHRVPYDWSAAAAKVRRAGLPARLAHRLEYGE